jgi:hypothetical protein
VEAGVLSGMEVLVLVQEVDFLSEAFHSDLRVLPMGLSFA